MDTNNDRYENTSEGLNEPKQSNPGNETFKHAENDPNSHKGSERLIENYNINDKAHSHSSKADFVKTVSNFHHADQEHNNDNPANE